MFLYFIFQILDEVHTVCVCFFFWGKFVRNVGWL
jgi:hypothetical protein